MLYLSSHQKWLCRRFLFPPSLFMKSGGSFWVRVLQGDTFLAPRLIMQSVGASFSFHLSFSPRIMQKQPNLRGHGIFFLFSSPSLEKACWDPHLCISRELFAVRQRSKHWWQPLSLANRFFGFSTTFVRHMTILLLSPPSSLQHM